MTASPGRRHGLMVLSAIALCWASGVAAAQPPHQPSTATPSLAEAMARVPAGVVVVYVTDTTGATIKGTLAAWTDDAVQVTVKRRARSLAAADIRRIQLRQSDSVLTGVLIGAGIGAIPGIYWLVVDPNECSGLCPEDYAAIAIGAAVGGLIDRAIRKRVTVYEAGSPRGGATTVRIAPLVRRDRNGVQVALTF